MDWPWFPRNFGKIMGNLRFLTRRHLGANRELKWHIFCNISGILLRGRFGSKFGQFLAVIRYRKGIIFRDKWIGRDFPKIFVKSWGIWHFRRAPILNDNRVLIPSPRNLANFKPRLAIKRGHFPQKFWRNHGKFSISDETPFWTLPTY